MKYLSITMIIIYYITITGCSAQIATGRDGWAIQGSLGDGQATSDDMVTEGGIISKDAAQILMKLVDAVRAFFVNETIVREIEVGVEEDDSTD